MSEPAKPAAMSAVEHALADLIAGQTESALRWGLAALTADASAGALLVTAKALGQLRDVGGSAAGEAAAGLRAAVALAIAGSRLALAVAAAHELTALGLDAGPELDAIAHAFCRTSKRLDASSAMPPPLEHKKATAALCTELSGAELAAAASEQLATAGADALAALAKRSGPKASPLRAAPLFSQLGDKDLRALIGAFAVQFVAPGSVVIEQGASGAEAYVVARGELDVERMDPHAAEPVALARLAGGALFGEMALMSRAPRTATVRAQRPCILLVATRDELERVAARDVNVGNELAAHCKRRMVANLVRTSPALLAVPVGERAALAARFRTVSFDSGERLIAQGDEARGLHLVASGSVAVIARDGADATVLASLGPGQIVGEVALVLRRPAGADVVAEHPTITLHLPDEDFMQLIEAHPAILLSLYLLAVAREQSNASANESATMDVTDDSVLV